MNDTIRRLLTHARLRAAPSYELVLFDRLSDGEQAAFAELKRDADFYGLMRPREGTVGTIKAVGCDTALLLHTLASASRLPHFALRSDAALEGVVTMLVAGILELEHGGAFVSAEAACALLSSPARDAAHHPLTRLSHDALRLVAADPALGSATIAGALYQANRQPSSPRWARRLPDRASVLAYVGVAPGSTLRRAAGAAWEIDGQQQHSPAWIYFVRRGSSFPGDAAGRDTTYKLYVSPTADALPAVFAAVLDAATRSQVRHLKLGSDLAGLLRPDKLVLYFADLASLTAVAASIEAQCAGASVQGVPFTAPIDRDGLLSWGADPPASAQLLAWQPRDSWRTWLAARLGGAIAECLGRDREVNTAFALERVRRDGVDIERWVATAALWTAA